MKTQEIRLCTWYKEKDIKNETRARTDDQSMLLARKIRASTVSGDNLARLFVMTLPAKEKILSDGTDDAGIANV
jgi:hypothetical protein